MNTFISFLDASGMSNAEFYRLNGTMSEERIVALLDGEAAAPDLGSVVCDLGEAKAGFPAEDCASALLEGMQKLAKRMRGDNRAALLELVGELEQLQTSLANDADYGRDKLDAAIRAIDGKRNS
ncbi:hypothetical protein P3T23_004552 [Paraburkholderia sp. GAS448]|jgi:hypothetical protein|uniref:hypothetical protein n=1 Tax=Paraburkholderia sp. GAS448 TaxID=3035136 RepID=UPI003D22729E